MPESDNHELTVFSAARQMPSAPRAAFLAEACAGDPALRQRIEELLQTGEQVATFMETPVSDFSNPRASLRRATVAPEKTGDRIGNYQLIEQIGEGGCGIVYRASQEQPVRREVALKVIKLGMDTKNVIARFEQERQALALMDHPNIARVLDAGMTDAGRPYFVMELVRGVKITDFCDEQNLSTSQRLELFMQVCRAIQHAHQKGIIHRDIKPSNILVTQHDGVPMPKVIDFGIAKATNGKLTDQTFFTACEQFIGTPAYMSPEQAGAGSLDVDTRSDIYSLGVLLYELLTGQTPFDAKELLQSGLDGIRRTIREDEPAPPSTRLSGMEAGLLAVTARHRRTESPQLIHSVRGDLDWIVMRALEKDRTRRYETANGLAADVLRHLNYEPVVARPPSNAYRFQKLVRRHRLIFAAAAIIAVILAVGVAISVRATIKEHRARLEADNARLRAQADEQKALTEAAKNRQVAQFLEDMLNGVGPSVAMGSDTTLLKKILDNTKKRIGADLAGQPEVEAELRYTLGEVYWEVGDLEDAEAMHRQALAIRLKVLGLQDPQTAQSMRSLAHVLWRRGNLNEAETMARLGITVQRVVFGSTNLEVARSLEDLAAILNTKNEIMAADAALREAVATKEALLGDTNLEVADSLDDLAYWDFSRRFKRPEAESLARKAIAIRQKLLGADNLLATVAALKLQATILDLQGKSSDQEATLYKLVAAQRQLFGNEHPSLAQSLNLLASVLENEGKLSASEPIRREALAMQRHLLGEENAEVAQTLFNLGELLKTEGKLTDAEPLYRDLLTMRRQLFGDGGQPTADALVELGKLLQAEGKTAEARELYLAKAEGTSLSSAAAQYALGIMYLNGAGVPKDAAAGVQWLRKSADLKNTRAQIDLAVLYFNGAEVPKDEGEALRWFSQASNLGSTAAMKTLANCYCAAGRTGSAIATLAKFCQAHPKDPDASLTLATWLAWFGKGAGYETARQQIIKRAAGTDEAVTAELAAKACCLRPSTNAVLLAKALDLAQFAAECRKGTPGLPWFQLSLGLAEYRNAKYAEAEQTLADAAQGADKHPEIPVTAGFFRAMSLFQRGRAAEARQLFDQTEAQMPPPPSDSREPVVGGKVASHEVIEGWLAYYEAEALIGPAKPKSVASDTQSALP